jgi:hypothetical protein
MMMVFHLCPTPINPLSAYMLMMIMMMEFFKSRQDLTDFFNELSLLFTAKETQIDVLQKNEEHKVVYISLSKEFSAWMFAHLESIVNIGKGAQLEGSSSLEVCSSFTHRNRIDDK